MIRAFFIMDAAFAALNFGLFAANGRPISLAAGVICALCAVALIPLLND